MRGNRPSLAESLRSLNRAPLAVGLVALTAGAFTVAALVLGGWSGGYSVLGLLSVALGVGLILLYYRVRRDQPPN